MYLYRFPNLKMRYLYHAYVHCTCIQVPFSEDAVPVLRLCILFLLRFPNLKMMYLYYAYVHCTCTRTGSLT